MHWQTKASMQTKSTVEDSRSISSIFSARRSAEQLCHIYYVETMQTLHSHKLRTRLACFCFFQFWSLAQNCGLTPHGLDEGWELAFNSNHMPKPINVHHHWCILVTQSVECSSCYWFDIITSVHPSTWNHDAFVRWLHNTIVQEFHFTLIDVHLLHIWKYTLHMAYVYKYIKSGQHRIPSVLVLRPMVIYHRPLRLHLLSASRHFKRHFLWDLRCSLYT